MRKKTGRGGNMIFKHRAHDLDKVMEIKQVETDITIVISTMCFANIMLPRKFRGFSQRLWGRTWIKVTK